MAAAEQPFDEREQRYFLAEVLKASSIAPSDLVKFVQEKGIRPSWFDIALPNGRSVSACQKAYNALMTSAAQTTAPFQPMCVPEQPQNIPKPKKKRPASGEAELTVADPVNQPHYSQFPSVNASNFVSPYQTAPGPAPAPIPGAAGAGAGGAGDSLKKKRGRPSKAEHELRAAAAAERGEIYPPPPKKPKTPRPSTEGAVNAALAAPGMAEGGVAGESFTAKKKTRKPRPPAPERNLALEATASAADQIQIDTEGAIRSTIPETQASEFPAGESMLAGMREHAAQEQPDTMQSTATLQQDSGPKAELESYQVATASAVD